MAHPIPTTADLKARYPEFESVSDARVSLFIEEALSYVGQCWSERDYKTAVLAAAAHLMAMEGEPRQEGAPVPPGTQLGAGIKRRKVGDVEVELNVSARSNERTGQDFWTQTSYGQTYWRLLRLNSPAIVAV